MNPSLMRLGPPTVAVAAIALLLSSPAIVIRWRLGGTRDGKFQIETFGGADLKGVMERMGHAQIQTTQKYLHTLPDTDQKNLDAFSKIADRRASPGPG